MNPAAPARAQLIQHLTAPEELCDSTRLLTCPADLRTRLEEDGYLLLRGVLPSQQVLDLRAVIIDLMDAGGWLLSRSPLKGRPDMPLEGDERHAPVYRRLLHHPAFSALAHCPAMMSTIGAALGGPVQVHNRLIGRLAPSHQPATQPHQDFHYIRGSLATLTAWLPIGDCPRELGGLAVLPGTHRLGYREHIRTTGAGGFGLPTESLGIAWRSTDFHAGDMLIFPACTIHAALPNRSEGHIRLSADFRYQRQGEAIDPGSLRKHFGLD